MAICDSCGAYGAKTLFDEGRHKGYFCYSCAEKVSISHGGGCSPRYSDNMEVRRLYHDLMSAPNAKWRGW